MPRGRFLHTVSPVHNLQLWLDLARQIEDQGADSLCIKDMAGLLKPYVAFELVSELKSALSIPIHMQCHATTGMSTATYVKSIEWHRHVDTSISSMSMTYGHSATESLVAILQDQSRDTGLDLELLEDISGYFREYERNTRPLKVLCGCGLAHSCRPGARWHADELRKPTCASKTLRTVWTMC